MASQFCKLYIPKNARVAHTLMNSKTGLFPTQLIFVIYLERTPHIFFCFMLLYSIHSVDKTAVLICGWKKRYHHNLFLLTFFTIFIGFNIVDALFLCGQQDGLLLIEINTVAKLKNNKLGDIVWWHTWINTKCATRSATAQFDMLANRQVMLWNIAVGNLLLLGRKRVSLFCLEIRFFFTTL